MILRVTVARIFPPFSLMLVVLILRLRVTASLSRTARLSELLTKPWAVAITV